MNSSDVIALLALIISAIVAIYSVYKSVKLNKSNLNSYYFNEIYREHLIKKIPVARKFISIDRNGKLTGYQHMIQEMKNIQTDSIYYKYVDNDYFINLKDVAQDLEEFLIINTEKTFGDKEETRFELTLSEKIQNVYRVLNKKYLE